MILEEICSKCGVKVKSTNLARHLAERCPKNPNKKNRRFVMVNGRRSTVFVPPPPNYVLSLPTLTKPLAEKPPSEFTIDDALYYLKFRNTLTTEQSKLVYAVEHFILGIEQLKEEYRKNHLSYEDEDLPELNTYILKIKYTGFEALGRKYNGTTSLYEILEHLFKEFAEGINAKVIANYYTPSAEEQIILKNWLNVLLDKEKIKNLYPRLIRYMIESNN